MIEYRQDYLLKNGVLKENAEALVNPVNCLGIMGKGLAYEFKQVFPYNFAQYQKACNSNQVQPGRMFTVCLSSLFNPKYIINFPTKFYWWDNSDLKIIGSGLNALVDEIKSYNIKSVAVPALGCGNGKLDWEEVKPLIELAFAELSGVHFIIFEPIEKQ